MGTTILFAQIFGVVLLVEGASMLIRPKEIHHLVGELIDSEALRYVVGMALLLLGLLAVLKHNVWGGSKLETVISLLSWAVLVKGAVYILAPKATFKHFEKLIQNKSIYPVVGVVLIVAGLYLAKIGF
ncbi:MAG: hypothetical protein O2794_03930 [bacterium]|nr:hypothetical protein [bacterium]